MNLRVTPLPSPVKCFEELCNFDYTIYSEKFIFEQDFHPLMIGGRNVCYTRLIAGENDLISKLYFLKTGDIFLEIVIATTFLDYVQYCHT